MTYSDILVDITDGIGRITMNRPRYRNAQSRRMIAELDDAFAVLRRDDSVKVIILAGAGSSFSAGHDLGTPEERESQQDDPIPDTVAGRTSWSWDWYAEPALRWREIPKPTIAQVQGHCIFAGWTLAAAMDIIVASPDALIVPHLSEVFTLPGMVGSRHAKNILFRNKPVSGTEAHELGMVTELAETAELESRALGIAREISAVDEFQLRMAKQAINTHEEHTGALNTARSGHAYNMLLYFSQLDGTDGAAASDGRRARMSSAETAVGKSAK